MIRFLVFLLCLSVSFSLRGHSLPKIGNPLISNYSKAEYKGGNQNWALAQDSSGIIYIANHQGLLTFDGADWQLFSLPNNEMVRSVFVDQEQGRIYVGGKEEFGYFYEKQFTLHYKNLSHQLDREFLKNDDIWKIWKTKEGVVFQSFSKIYVLQKDSLHILYGDGQPFLFSHQVSDELWIEKIPSGLSRMKSDKLENLSLSVHHVMAILPYKKEEHLVFTAKDGIYLKEKNGSIKPWAMDASLRHALTEAQINNGLSLGGGMYALGTIKNGIFIIDDSGRLRNHIHRRTGLQNNTVLSLMLDKQGNLWAGLDNGIDRIEINSPFYYYQDIDGAMGTVYAVKVFKDKIYLGTNQGLYYNDWKQEGENANEWSFEFVPGSQGQVWSLEVFNGQLICGHNEGTFVVQDNKLKEISDRTGGWLNIPIKGKPDYFVQGNYTGMAVFREEGKEWSFLEQLSYPEEMVKYIVQKDRGHFWVVLSDEIQLVKLDLDRRSIHQVKSFSFHRDLPDVGRVFPFEVEGNILFSTSKGLFVYDDLLNVFQRYTSFDKLLGSFAKANSVHSIGDKKYFFALDGRFALLEFGEELTVDSTSFSVLKNKVMKNFEIVQKIEDMYVFGLDYGIAVYNSLFKGVEVLPQPIIKSLQDFSHASDSSHVLDWDRSLQNKQNNLRIYFSAPWYSAIPLEYVYRLEGLQDNWSTPMSSPYVDFTNLPSGKYTFQVRSVDMEGRVSEISEKSFYINKAWYLQWQAWVIYIFLLIVIGIAVRYLLRKRIKKQKHQLMQKLRASREKFLKEQEEENEKKLMHLENKRLAEQLKMKKRELSNLATNIVYKNEVLNNLREELLNLRDTEGKEFSKDQLKKIDRLMDKARSDERDWDIFEKSFNESHGDFFKKLKKNYPSLTPNDLKLCAYLRLNMTSKEVASLFNITIRGVEVRRYRLRKKFNLETETNLTEFLLKL